MADRDGGAAIEKHLRNGSPHDRRASQNDGSLTRDLLAGGLDELNDARGGAGHESTFVTAREQAGVERVEAIDVLGRINRLKNCFLIVLFRQRKLNQNAVDVFVGIKGLNQTQEIFGAGVRRNGVLGASNIALFGGSALEPYIGGAGGIVTGQHDHQMGCRIKTGRKLFDLRFDFAA